MAMAVAVVAVVVVVVAAVAEEVGPPYRVLPEPWGNKRSHLGSTRPLLVPEQ
jgi:hypothetical protein